MCAGVGVRRANVVAMLRKGTWVVDSIEGCIFFCQEYFCPSLGIVFSFIFHSDETYMYDTLDLPPNSVTISTLEDLWDIILDK